MPEIEILQALSAGGDVATIALVWALWKVDRRLLRLEFHIGPGEGKENA